MRAWRHGARARELAQLLGVGLTTLQRWRRQFAGDGDGVDRRKGSHRQVAHRLSEEERQRILLTCNEPEFAALPPGQIVPVLADRGLYIGSERSFYRVLHAHGQAHRRGRARPPQEPRPVPRLRAAGPNQVWSWDITYLPTSRARDLAVPLPGDRRLEPQGGGLGCRRAGRPSHRSGSGEQGLPARADQQGAPPAADPPCRQRQRHACGHAGKPAGGTGRAQVVLPAAGQQRQPLLRIAVPHGEIPA